MHRFKSKYQKFDHCIINLNNSTQNVKLKCVCIYESSEDTKYMTLGYRLIYILWSCVLHAGRLHTSHYDLRSLNEYMEYSSGNIGNFVIDSPHLPMASMLFSYSIRHSETCAFVSVNVFRQMHSAAELHRWTNKNTVSVTFTEEQGMGVTHRWMLNIMYGWSRKNEGKVTYIQVTNNRIFTRNSLEWKCISWELWDKILLNGSTHSKKTRWLGKKEVGVGYFVRN